MTVLPDGAAERLTAHAKRELAAQAVALTIARANGQGPNPRPGDVALGRTIIEVLSREGHLNA